MSLPELGPHIERLRAWHAGAIPPVDETDSAVRDLKAALAAFEAADDRLAAASAAFFLSMALRLRAEVVAPEATALLQRACSAAERGRAAAIADAERDGVNDRNTASYVAVTNEAAHAHLALAELQHGSEAGQSFRQAASYFGEAAAGYRRQKSDEDARKAELKALEARGKAALAELDGA